MLLFLYVLQFNPPNVRGDVQSIAIKDNDSLSALLAANIQADLLILMSDVDGIYNKPPWEDGARLMHTYTSQDRNTIEFGKKSKVSSVCFTERTKQNTNTY